MYKIDPFVYGRRWFVKMKKNC